DVNALRSSGQLMATLSMQPSLQPAHPVLPQTTLQGMQAYVYPQAATITSQLQPLQPLHPAPLSHSPRSQGSGDMASFLLTEARQHNTEIRMAVSKVADKMDHLMTKVEELQKHNAGNSLLIPSMSVTVETSMIMSNIQRIIQENERLKQEVLEKNNRIEEQNEKISELIERNQRYVEQSNLMMEKRNNSLQTATENTQARVLHAEQEKAKVTEELVAATAQVSHLQLKMTAHQKKEMELQMKLTESLKETDHLRGQLSKLQAEFSVYGLLNLLFSEVTLKEESERPSCGRIGRWQNAALKELLGRRLATAALVLQPSVCCYIPELQETSERAQSKFKGEKQSRRQLELKVTSLEEELSDLRSEKESLEKNLSERKKKSAQERCQAEEEIDEIRKSYQEEMDRLRQLLKKARVSTDQAAAEQLSVVQAELKTQWEAKCEHLLASTKDEHRQQYQEVCAQRDANQQKLLQLQEKAQVTALKEQNEQYSKDLEKYKTLEPGVEATATDPSEKIKKIMNQVFQSLRGEFELEEFYNGRTILGTIMNTIKMVTLELLNHPEQEKGESSSEEEEEEERPRQAFQEQSVSAGSGLSHPPLHRESAMVPSERAVREAGPLPPQALPGSQEDVQRREGKPSAAEVLSEIKDDFLPPELAYIPSQRALGPPTSIPPKPPGPAPGDSGYEETLAASPLENTWVREQENAARLSLASDSKKGDLLALGPETLGGEPEPPELKKDEDVTGSAVPSKEPDSTEAGFPALEAAPGPSHCSQPSRLSGDDNNELLKRAALKVPRPKAQREEEDEDEVVRKSQPL
ncbi:hypothetical protein MC885_021029, partial [Smutsia gigantea]